MDWGPQSPRGSESCFENTVQGGDLQTLICTGIPWGSCSRSRVRAGRGGWCPEAPLLVSAYGGADATGL